MINWKNGPISNYFFRVISEEVKLSEHIMYQNDWLMLHGHYFLRKWLLVFSGGGRLHYGLRQTTSVQKFLKLIF